MAIGYNVTAINTGYTVSDGWITPNSGGSAKIYDVQHNQTISTSWINGSSDVNIVIRTGDSTSTGSILSCGANLYIEAGVPKISLDYDSFTKVCSSGDDYYNPQSLNSNTTYYFQLILDASNNLYTLKYSTDGVSYTEMYRMVGASFSETSERMQIETSDPILGAGLNCSINLAQSSISDGVWEGTYIYSNPGTRIQIRRDTSTNWTTVNPVLLEGELGLETDTGLSKAGDGTSHWNTLDYTKVDLSNYYNKTQVDSQVANVENQLPLYVPTNAVTAPITYSEITQSVDCVETGSGKFWAKTQTYGASSVPFINSYLNCYIPTTGGGNGILNPDYALFYSGTLIGNRIKYTRSNSASSMSDSSGCIIGNLDIDGKFTPYFHLPCVSYQSTSPYAVYFYENNPTTIESSTQYTGITSTKFNYTSINSVKVYQDQWNGNIYKISISISDNNGYPYFYITAGNADGTVNFTASYSSNRAISDKLNCVVFPYGNSNASINNNYYMIDEFGIFDSVGTQIWNVGTSTTNRYLQLGIGSGLAIQNDTLVNTNPTAPTVDQAYNSTSTNAQSGVAIAGAGFLTGITPSDVTTALGYSPASSIPEGLNLSISSGLLTAQPGVVLSSSNNALVSSASITTSNISTISTAQDNNVILGNTSSTTTLEINSLTGTYLYGALSARMNNYKTEMSADNKGSWLFASSSQGSNSNSWASYGFEFNTEVPAGTFNITLKSSTQDWVYVYVTLWDNNGTALYQSGQETGNISLEVTTASPVKAITVQANNYQYKMAPFNCNIQTTITSQDYDVYLCKDNNSLDLKLTTNPSELSSYTDYAKIGLIQYTANANPVAFPTEPLSDMFLNNRLVTKPTEPNTTLVKGKSLKNIVPLAQADYTILVNNSSIDTTTLYIIADTGAIYLGTTLIAEKN